MGDDEADVDFANFSKSAVFDFIKAPIVDEEEDDDEDEDGGPPSDAPEIVPSLLSFPRLFGS